MAILVINKNKSDDVLCKVANRNKVIYYRESSKNVLKRWSECLNKFKVDIDMIRV